MNYTILQECSFDSEQISYGPFADIMEAKAALKQLFGNLVTEEKRESDSFRPRDSMIGDDGMSAVLTWDGAHGEEDTETLTVIALNGRYGASMSIPLSKGEFVSFTNDVDGFIQAGLLFRCEDGTELDLSLAEKGPGAEAGFSLMTWGDVRDEDYTEKTEFSFREIESACST